MRRREFIVRLGGVMVAPLGAGAQPATKRPLVGYLDGGSASDAPYLAALLAGLSELGYAQGQSLDVISLFGEGAQARLPELAREMVRRSPDVIVAQNTTAALAARSVTQTIPIVAGVLTDPVNFGLVQNHARPGGNVTGLLSAVDGLSGKQLELASEIVSGATKVGVLFNADNRGNDPQRKEIEIAAAARDIKLQLADIRRAADLPTAFQVLMTNNVQVVVVVRDTLAFSERQHVALLAAASRLPTVFGWRQGPEAGGLASYGIRTLDNYRRAAVFVDKILKGEKASDLPLEFATKLELVINLKTAKALGLSVPPTLLARADEVIE
jgi:ABC-type uncharacterized transport system substrate-binding protein